MICSYQRLPTAQRAAAQEVVCDLGRRELRFSQVSGDFKVRAGACQPSGCTSYLDAVSAI